MGILIIYRHFGNLQNAEKKFLIQFDEIIGLPGYISVWKSISNLCVVETTPDRSGSPQYSPVFDIDASKLHQILFNSDDSSLQWQEVQKTRFNLFY
jgi:hypothetical protein